MHVFIAAMYGAIVWLAGLAYCVIIGLPLFAYLLVSPFVISGVAAAILTLDLLAWSLAKAWRRIFAEPKTD